MSGDYWASLPGKQRVELSAIARKYGIESIPDADTALHVLQMQYLEIDVLEAHAAWLTSVKAAVKSLGRPWTPAEMNRYLEQEGEG